MPIEDYRIDAFLGKGSFGEVFRGHHLRTGETFALKIIDLDEASDVRELIKEIRFLSRVSSEYLTRYYETFVQDTRMWIVLEYCGGGSCLDLISHFGKLPEGIACVILKDVLKGLNYLHTQKKVHRDIKSANILLTSEGRVKLADFGVSGEMSLTRPNRNTLVGTPYWMAPEVIIHVSKGYDTKADIWSTGITTIEFVTGRPPLSSVDPMEALFKIPKSRPPELEGEGFSEEIKDFVKHCLIKSAKQRPSAACLLRHRFITMCPPIDMAVVLAQKRAKEEGKKKKARPLKLSTDNCANIEWMFGATLDASTRKSPLSPTQNVYSELIYESFTKVMARAKSASARLYVESLRAEFVESELKNPGFSYAFAEELHASIEDRRF